MPEISRFFGIIITMYYGDHDPPHFHVRYGDQKARFAVDDLRMLDGYVSPRVKSLVTEWASKHRDELRKDWRMAKDRVPLSKIAPLE